MKERFFPGVVFLIESLLRGWSILLLGLGIVAAVKHGGEFQRGQIVAVCLAFALLLVARRFAGKYSVRVDALWLRLGIVLLFFAGIACFAWVFLFDSVQISDFGVYFRCGTSPHQNLAAWMAACQSKYLHSSLIFWNRSLFYTFPVGKLAGANYAFLKASNACWHVATFALWFYGVRHYFGARIATISMIFLVLYPEWWYTPTLATTDNMAIFFIVAFLLLVPQLSQVKSHRWVVPTLAIIVFVTNQLRTIGPILELALLIWGAGFSCQQKSFRPLLRVMVVILFYSIMNVILLAVVTHSVPMLKPEPHFLLRILSVVDFHSLNDFDSNYPWGENFWMAIPADVRVSVALHKIFLEFVNGFDQLPLYLFHKVADFFTGYGYYYFAAAPVTGYNADTVFTVPQNTMPFGYAILPWFKGLITLLLTLSSWALWRNSFRTFGQIAVIYLGAFFFIIFVLGEVQPRYSVLVMPVLALLMALALFPDDSLVSSEGTAHPRGATIKMVLMGLLLIGLVFEGFVQLTYGLSANVINPLAAIKQDPYQKIDGQECNVLPVKMESNYKRLRINPVSGSSCVSVSLMLPPSVHAISFFVSGTHFPYLYETPVVSPYGYQVRNGDQLLLDTTLADQSVRWHQLHLKQGVQPLSFVLKTKAGIEPDEPFDIWFLQLS